MFAAATVVAHLVAAKAARDALFLATFEVTVLPRMMVLGALVSLAVAFISAQIAQRYPPTRLLLGALATSAAGYAFEWVLIDAAPRQVALMLYLHVSAFGATLVAALWSLVNERFDPHAAKRQIARIALGGSLGGVLGGLGAWLVSGTRGMAMLLATLGLLNLATIAAVLLLSRRGRFDRIRSRLEPTDRMSALKALRDSPYLATLATLVALSALSSALLDYVLSARLVAHQPDAAHLAAFFALFHAGVGLSAMLVQLVLTRAVLERLGLAGTVALGPVVVSTLGVVAIAVPHVWSIVVLRGSEALVQASLSRSAYELFYTPIPRAQKRPAKMFIDVGVDRMGTMAGGSLTALIVLLMPEMGKHTFVAVAMGVSLGAVYCAARLHRGYVEALAGRLRRGGMKLDPRDVFDATTRRTLADSMALDRKKLLEAIEREASQPPPSDNETAQASPDAVERHDTVLVGPGGAGFEAAPGYVGLQLGSSGRFGVSDERPARDAWIDAVADLRSGDASKIRSVLAAPLEPDLAAHVVPLLGRDEVARDAVAALRGVAERITGTLSDFLLDPELSVIVRRRIPRVLERCPTARATQALVEGLFDSEPEVRSQCALALLRVIELDPNVPLARDRIVDAIEHDLSSEPGKLPFDSNDAFDGQPGFGEGLLSAPTHPRIEHIMTLLALVLEPEQVRLAYHALYGGDPAIRGTALEYLDNVLPERIKPRVLAMIEGSAVSAGRSRGRELASVVDELLRSRELVMPASKRGAR